MSRMPVVYAFLFKCAFTYAEFYDLDLEGGSGAIVWTGGSVDAYDTNISSSFPSEAESPQLWA